MLTRIYASKTEENKKDTGADRFQQQCFESLKKYVKESYRELQESMKLQVKGDTIQNIKSRNYHFFKNHLELARLFIMT